MGDRDGRWIRLAANYTTDPAIMRVRYEAELLYVRGLCMARAQNSDGHLAKEWLPLIAIKLDPRVTRRCVAQLVEAGLWEECDDGWRVPWASWSRWQTTSAEWDAQRERERERKAKQRARLALVREEEKRWS